jgi:hypothetical protein
VDAYWYLLDTITAQVIVKMRLVTTRLAAKVLVIAAQLLDKSKRIVTNLIASSSYSFAQIKY